MVATSRPRTESFAAASRDAADLRREAVWLARYLIDVVPSDALIERYVRANARVLEPPTARDANVLAFVHEHPWSLGLLDAGTAFTRGAPLLRRKLVVMMAILEATPEHIGQTAPIDDAGIPVLVWRVGRAGATAAVKLVAGSLLATLVMVRRAR